MGSFIYYIYYTVSYKQNVFTLNFLDQEIAFIFDQLWNIRPFEMSYICRTGIVHLHGYYVLETSQQGKKFGFTLLAPETTLRTFHFFAENQTDYAR